MSRHLLVNPPVLAVDPMQVDLYAEAIPFGLIQIATHLRRQGHAVTFLDMMGYADRDFVRELSPARRWDAKPLGDARVGATRDTFLYGRPLSWLAEQTDALEPPDDIWVTCCISFNYEPAFAVIRLLRERFPAARIRLGGFYPTAFPEHARRSGADVVHEGRMAEVEGCFPELGLLERVPPIWLFRLVRGCRYRCSFCINARERAEVIGEPAAVVEEIAAVHRGHGVETFSNWDPNVMLRLDVLEPFLDRLAAAALPVTLKFEMGIQPNRLTTALAARMRRAGTGAMTIPFESAEPQMMRRFGKPYRMEHAMDAVARCRELGYDTRRFHCTFVLGIRGETLRHVFRTYFGVLKAGGHPTPFPLSITPGTREHEAHAEHLGGKDLADLNGHLWPALDSLARVRLYDRLYAIVTQPDVQEASRLARDLPRRALDAFRRERDWYLEGPHPAPAENE
jgi:radical SAM superfamily enzyme YgiQ (UPF0313 family)